jgi:cytoskeletal protein RodZ
MSAYTYNRESANDLVIESSAVAAALLAFAEKEIEWLGPATELLQEINTRVSESAQRSKTWPKDGRSLSNRLRRLAPNLRAAGLTIEFDLCQGKRKRLIRLEWVGNSASVASSGEETSNNPDATADASNDSGRRASEPADANTREASSVKATETKDEQAGTDAEDAEDAKKQGDSDDDIEINFDFGCCPTCGFEGPRFTDCPECGDEIR